MVVLTFLKTILFLELFSWFNIQLAMLVWNGEVPLSSVYWQTFTLPYTQKRGLQIRPKGILLKVEQQEGKLSLK